MSLEDFIRKRVSPYVVNHMTVFLGRDTVDDNHNAKLCSRRSGVLLERSLKRLASFNYVGLKETYESDLRRLSILMGIDLPVLHANRPGSAPENSINELTVPLLIKLHKLNTLDAILYDYANILHERLFANKSMETMF